VGRRIAAEWPAIDAVEPKPDGSHLTELWRKRMLYYPQDRPDLLHRLVLDALKAIDQVEDGHVAVDTYRMEERLPRIQCPVMLVCGTRDWAAFPDQERLAKYLPGARRVEIPDAACRWSTTCQSASPKWCLTSLSPPRPAHGMVELRRAWWRPITSCSELPCLSAVTSRPGYGVG
jgi:hypothetical protein